MALMAPLKSTSFSHGSEWYEISDEYDASVTGFSGDFEYFGYLNIVGGWIIQRHQISTGAYRYIQGASSYTAAWSGKSGLQYDYYNTLIVTNP